MAQAVIDSQIVLEGQLLRPDDRSMAAAWRRCVFVVSVVLILLGFFGPPSPGSNFDGLLRALVGLAWIGFGLIAVRKVRSGVIVEKEELVVRSWIRSSRYQWREIEQFHYLPLLAKKALRIDLKDGRRIYADGFSVRSPDEARRAEEMVAELNRRVITV